MEIDWKGVGLYAGVLSSGLRIACTRDSAKFGMRPVREAADPERLAALWRSNEPG
jgi:hypothetical protein